MADAPRPATDVKLTGLVKLVGYYDLGGLQGQDGFKITQIDTAENRNEDHRLSGDLKQTRLRFDATRRGTRFGQVKAVVEADFRGTGGSSANLPLRYAFVEVGRFTVGQTRSVFGDADADAGVIDLEGPPTGVALRTPQVRFATNAGRWRWTLAAEVAGVDYSTLPEFDPEVVSTYLRRPDLTASVRYGTRRAHVQLGGVVREIRYRRRAGSDSGEATSESLTGGGVAASGNVTFSPGSRVVFQAVAGKGIAHYLSSFSGGGWDAVPTGLGQLELTTDTGGYLAYMHTAGRFRATALLGGTAVTNPIREGLPDFFRGYVASLTGFYDLLDSLWVGLEVDYGRIRDFRDRRGDATRLQFGMQARF